MFIDDNFIGNISWTKQFLERIKPLKLNWNAAVTMKIGQHPELMDLMKETGCQSLFIGFESISSQSLSSVHKMQIIVKSLNDLLTNYISVVLWLMLALYLD